VQRVGSDNTIHVNVRLIVATNRDIEQEMEAGRFRADLYHRLNVYPIRVPPLRERKEDIPLLAGYFCELTQRRLGTGPVRINAKTMNILIRYYWPGNVRELENIVSRAILKASIKYSREDTVVVEPVHLGADFSDEAIQPQQTIPERPSSLPAGKSFREAVEDFQRQLITVSVANNAGNWSAAARDLGMHRSNLHNLSMRLGLRKKKA
jgi:anaerobic nitric oxide reductase transcription regulator